MPKHTIVAQFNDYGAAHRAFSELLRTGVEPNDISLIAGDRSDRHGATRDFGILADEADFFITAVRRGTTLLAVNADDKQGAAIAEIIKDHSATEIEVGEADLT